MTRNEVITMLNAINAEVVYNNDNTIEIVNRYSFGGVTFTFNENEVLINIEGNN